MKAFPFLAVVVLSFFCSVLAITSYADPPLPTPVGRVVWIKGDSLKAVMENKEERLLQKQSLIYLHDVLLTNDATQAEIVFTDNTLITFKPNTKFSIDQYSYQPKKQKGSVGKSIMSLIEGGFRTITGVIAKSNPPDYQVNTPIATIGVRGTTYAVYLDNGQIYVAYYEGSPCVTPNKHGGTLCLDAKTPYAEVKSATSAPQPLTQRPSVFDQTLELTPATISNFVTPISRQGGNSQGGTVTSFCIQ